MDYIYSEISKQVANSYDYKGALSSTAIVTVDNVAKTIKVDVKPFTNDLLNDNYKTQDGDSNYILLVIKGQDGKFRNDWIKVDSIYQRLVDLEIDLGTFEEQTRQELNNLSQKIEDEALRAEQAESELRSDLDDLNAEVDHHKIVGQIVSSLEEADSRDGAIVYVVPQSLFYARLNGEWKIVSSLSEITHSHQEKSSDEKSADEVVVGLTLDPETKKLNYVTATILDDGDIDKK